MAKIKMFPRVDLTIPGIEHTRCPHGEVVIPLEDVPPLIEMHTDCLRAHPKDKVLFLCLFKRRGNKISQVPLRVEGSVESLSSIMPTVAHLIRRVIELTDSLRQEAPLHLKDRMWLYRMRSIKDNGKVAALSRSILYNATQKLIRDYGLRDVDGKLLRINVSRLRKTFTNRIYEILDNDPVATAMAAGNSLPVLGNHYLRPGKSSERNWKFMGVALTQELMTATLGATEMTPTGRCTDNLQGAVPQERRCDLHEFPRLLEVQELRGDR